MKRFTLIMISLAVLSIGCNIFGAKPQEVLSKYLNNFYKGSAPEAYALLSSKDKSFKSQKEYQDEISNPLARVFADKISYKIKEAKINGNTAVITVEITHPDMTKIAAEIMGLALASAFGQKNDKEIAKMITEKFKDRQLPTTTDEQNYELIKENEGWRVFLNWEGKKKASEAIKQAEQLEKSKKFDDAKTKYQEALALDKTNADAKERLAAVDKLIEDYKIKKAYFEKIEVKNIHLGTSFLREIGVFGEIKNNGDKTLKRVEVTAYCLDKEGKVVFEKSFLPVLVTEYSFMSDNTPLKPNYSRRFGFKLDDAPSDWSKKVKVSVTDVDFQ